MIQIVSIVHIQYSGTTSSAKMAVIHIETSAKCELN